MHGATLLGRDDRPLCPSILWSDGPFFQECEELTKNAVKFDSFGGSLVMPGFAALLPAGLAFNPMRSLFIVEPLV